MAEHAELCVVLRDESGAVTPNTAVSVWSDAEATTLATLYTTRTGTLTYANPLSSDADGILHCFVEDPRLWYTTATQTTPLPLPVQAYSGTVNVKDFGALGDNTADDTAAFAAAIAYVDALEGVWPIYEKPEILVPAGRYRISNIALPAHKNIKLRGAGQHATVLIATDTDGIMFDLGTFDSTPEVVYSDVTRNFELSQLSILEWTHDRGQAPGRTATCIRDSGNGGIHLDHVSIRGFQYGVVLAYGSDFDSFENCHFIYNDIGIEVGPSCNQGVISHCEFSGNGIGVLYEWPGGGTLNEGWFIDQHEYDVKFDFTSPTVAGVVHNDSAAMAYTHLNRCQFESGAGSYGSGALADPPGSIYIGGTTSTPKNITITDCSGYMFTNTSDDMMAAEDAGTVYAFVRLAAGQEIRIEGYQYTGHRFDALVAPLDGYTSGRVYVSQVQIASGDTLPIYSPWPTAGHVYEEDMPTALDAYGHVFGFGGDFWRMRHDAGENAIVIGHGTDGSTFTERIKLYPASGKFAGSPDGVNFATVTWGGDPTGIYGMTGDIRFNIAPSAGGKVGWVCVSGGSPGTWKPFGVIDS